MYENIFVYTSPVLMTWQHFILANIHHYDTPMGKRHCCSKPTTWGVMK
jgi:hypothetical protein